MDVEFVYAVPSSLTCPVCQDVLRDPVITRPCSHSFCTACIWQALETESSCPICRQPLTGQDLHNNLALAAVIQELPVYCRFKNFGCTATFRFELKASHEMYCGFAPMQCPNVVYGCKFEGGQAMVRTHVAEACVFEKIKPFFVRNEERIADMTREIQRQAKEIQEMKALLEKHTTQTEDTSTPDLSQVKGDWFQEELHCRETLSGQTCGVTSLAYSEGILFSGGHDGSTKVWDLQTNTTKKTLIGHQKTVWTLAYDKLSNRLFSGSSDGTIMVWDLKTDDARPATLRGHQGRINAVALFRNRLFSVSSDKRMKIWNLETLECITTLDGHTDDVNALVNIPTGNTMATASSDGTVKIWDLERSTCDNTIVIGSSQVLGLVQGDGAMFASCSDASISILSLQNYNITGSLRGHNWEIWQLAYAGRGCLFSGSFDHTIKRWDIRTGLCTSTLSGHKGYVHAITLGNQQLISGCADKTIKLWS